MKEFYGTELKNFQKEKSKNDFLQIERERKKNLFVAVVSCRKVNKMSFK